MKHDISILDALRSLMDYAEEKNLPAATNDLLSMLEDISRRFDVSPARPAAQILPFQRGKPG